MKQTMLIADGDAELCDVYRRFSTERGYEVETSADGLDCVRKLRQVTPAVLVLDLELPWGGGDGVLGWLREEPQFLPSRVVLTSAEASAYILDSLASPPVETLTKPFPLSALLHGPAFVASVEPKRPSNACHRRGLLVVDDDPADRALLQAYLHNHGFHVWASGDGEEALDHCCDHGEEIVAILLNVQMQGLDGQQTIEAIRAYDLEIPVCFITADSGDYETSDLLRLGARHLFGKPFRMDEIVRVVCNLANEPMEWPQENRQPEFGKANRVAGKPF